MTQHAAPRSVVVVAHDADVVHVADDNTNHRQRRHNEQDTGFITDCLD